MSSPLVQIASGSNQFTRPGNTTTTLSISQAFASANTAGDTITVAVGVSQANTQSSSGFSCGDTQGNSYTEVFEIGSGTDVGPAMAFFVAKNVAGGANTVTVSYSGVNLVISLTFTNLIVIAEYSGLGAAPTIESHGTNQQWTGSPTTTSLTDSNGTTVSFGTTTNDSNFDFGLIDIFAGGTNYLFACYMGSSSTPTTAISPLGYATMTDQAAPTLNGWYLHYWDSSPAGGASTPPLSISCGSPPIGYRTVPYSHTFPVSGGVPGAHTFTLASGSLPTGLTLDGTTGVVSGTPLSTGTSSFTIEVADSASPADAASVACSIEIDPLLPPNPSGPPNLYLAKIGVADVTGTAVTLSGTLTGGVPFTSADFQFLGSPIMIALSAPAPPPPSNAPLDDFTTGWGDFGPGDMLISGAVSYTTGPGGSGSAIDDLSTSTQTNRVYGDYDLIKTFSSPVNLEIAGVADPSDTFFISFQQSLAVHNTLEIILTDAASVEATISFSFSASAATGNWITLTAARSAFTVGGGFDWSMVAKGEIFDDQVAPGPTSYHIFVANAGFVGGATPPGSGSGPFWTTVAAITDATHLTLTVGVPVDVTGVEIDVYFPVIRLANPASFRYWVLLGSYDFQSSLSTRPTLNFDIYSEPLPGLTASYIPDVGMPALLIVGTVNGTAVGDVFGGSIDQVQAEAVPKKLPVVSKCQCVSWDQVLTRRLLLLTGAYPLGSTTDSFVGDGGTTVFNLTQEPLALTSVTLAGIQQTFGLSGSGAFAIWAPNSLAVTCQPAPGAGKQLTISYDAVGASIRVPAYQNLTADQIFFALISTIIESEVLAAAAVLGPTVDQISFTTQDTVDSALTSLLSYINDDATIFWYYIDPRKAAHFEISGVTQTAPWAIDVSDSSDANVLVSVSLTRTREKFANAAWVDIAAARGRDTITVSFRGNGSATSFQAAYPFGSAVSGSLYYPAGQSVAQEILVTGSTPVTPANAWFFDIGGTTLTQDGSGVVLASGMTLVITYYPALSITEDYYNSDSIAARKLIEGGSGEYDVYANLSNTNPVLQTATVAENLATYYAALAQRLQIVTFRGGLKTGQGMTVNLPQIGATGTFVVDQVQLRDIGTGGSGVEWQWTVTLSAGAIIGDWKKAMTGLANLL